METQNYQDWNRLVYYVSDVYSATKKFKPGEQLFLAEKIRKSAVSVSVGLNDMPRLVEESDFARIYPIISAISVLETYLQLAKTYGFLKDISVLGENLTEVKEILYRILGETKTIKDSMNF
jgi:four helix bundle protein